MTPFEILGLPATDAVTDDDVRGAWRRRAAATHPDRPDGGDPAAFAAAAAAYTALRTRAARAEAMAEVSDPAGGRGAVGIVPGRWPLTVVRPARLAARLLAAGLAGALAVVATGWQPATAGVITGALTWLFLTGRADVTGRRRE